MSLELPATRSSPLFSGAECCEAEGYFKCHTTVEQHKWTDPGEVGHGLTGGLWLLQMTEMGYSSGEDVITIPETVRIPFC